MKSGQLHLFSSSCRGSNRMRKIPVVFSRIMSSSSSSSPSFPTTTSVGATTAASQIPMTTTDVLQGRNGSVRSKTTTATTIASSIWNYISSSPSSSLQESVKQSLLDKASTSSVNGEKVWSDTAADDTYHRHHPRFQNNQQMQQEKGERNENDGGERVNDTVMSSSSATSSMSVSSPTPISPNTTTMWHHHDPLDDLLLQDVATKYWPGLPPSVRSATADAADPFHLAKADVDSLSQSIREDLIGTDHPVLNQAASYFFGTADGGKKVRPLMVMLLSRALTDTLLAMEQQRQEQREKTEGAETQENTGSIHQQPSTTINSTRQTLNGKQSDDDVQSITSNSDSSSSSSSSATTTMFIPPLPWQRQDLPQAQRRLAEISEMIHTASLFHDDVIDGSETRRGNPAVHMVFGNKTAILAGDYLLARASISLARLRHIEVVETMSTIIEHLVRGEVMQMRGNHPSAAAATSSTREDGGQNATKTSNDRMTYYLKKNYYKTGSLMANSCKSAALLADCPQDLVLSSYQYGKHVGMAFQLVDDVLDFEGDVISMGKPALADLRAGLSTAPVLFAAEEYPELEAMMDRKFKQDGDVEQAREWVLNSSGMERTKNLARVHAERAMDAVMSWHGDSIYRDALVNLAYKVVERTK